MKALVSHKYGPPDVLQLVDVDKPVVAADGLLVRVRASSVNPAEWYAVTGTPLLFRGMMGGLRRPKPEVRGVEFAGTVEAVGSDVTLFKPGDDVFGGRTGAWAEYVSVRQPVAPKPANLTFEQAAAIPTAATTALQGLRDYGRLRAGHRVLINGASGGVGTFAVQIAKALGAEVTGVCSTRNVDIARSLGADYVVDYTKEDFTRSGERYDLLLDVSGTRSWFEYKRVLKDDATHVIVGAPKSNPWIGPLGHVLKIRLTAAALRASQKVVFFIAKFNREDFMVLRDLIESGKVTPIIDRRYHGLTEIPEALRYLGQGHAQGKVVITV